MLFCVIPESWFLSVSFPLDVAVGEGRESIGWIDSTNHALLLLSVLHWKHFSKEVKVFP